MRIPLMLVKETLYLLFEKLASGVWGDWFKYCKGLDDLQLRCMYRTIEHNSTVFEDQSDSRACEHRFLILCFLPNSDELTNFNNKIKYVSNSVLQGRLMYIHSIRSFTKVYMKLLAIINIIMIMAYSPIVETDFSIYRVLFFALRYFVHYALLLRAVCKFSHLVCCLAPFFLPEFFVPIRN